MLFTLLLGLVATSQASARDITAHPGETIGIAVSQKTGSLVAFPRPIKVVGSSLDFRIKRVSTEIDSKSTAPVNIRIVNVTPKHKNSTETVPFILAGGKTIHVRFYTSSYAQKHYAIKLPRSATGVAPGEFLELETRLMRQMLRDHRGEGFSRHLLHEKLKIEGFSELDLMMVRRFSGHGLFGYTFKLTNTSDEPVTINPEALNFGSPNQAALLQVDHTTLRPCAEDNSLRPDSESCVTAIRLVVRSQDFSPPRSGRDLPFLLKREEG